MSTEPPPSIADQVFAFVQANQPVTFAALQGFLRPIMRVDGVQAFEFTEIPNLCLWAKMSPAFHSLVERLLEDRWLFLHPSKKEDYTADGQVLNMPVVKEPEPVHYASPVWFPVALCTEPAAKKRGWG